MFMNLVDRHSSSLPAHRIVRLGFPYSSPTVALSNSLYTPEYSSGFGLLGLSMNSRFFLCS
jgi:hypothetical protein